MRKKGWDSQSTETKDMRGGSHASGYVFGGTEEIPYGINRMFPDMHRHTRFHVRAFL